MTQLQGIKSTNVQMVRATYLSRSVLVCHTLKYTPRFLIGKNFKGNGAISFVGGLSLVYLELRNNYLPTYAIRSIHEGSTDVGKIGDNFKFKFRFTNMIGSFHCCVVHGMSNGIEHKCGVVFQWFLYVNTSGLSVKYHSSHSSEKSTNNEYRQALNCYFNTY